MELTVQKIKKASLLWRSKSSFFKKKKKQNKQSKSQNTKANKSLPEHFENYGLVLFSSET